MMEFEVTKNEDTIYISIIDEYRQTIGVNLAICFTEFEDLKKYDRWN